MQNISGGGNRLLGQFAAQKKKAVIALCLIGVMAFMWGKVLFKKSPQAAQAATTTKQAQSNGQLNSQFVVSGAEPLKVSFIDLPKVAGRNDVITRDFFDSRSWQEFVRNGENNAIIGEVNVPVENGDKEVVRTIVEKLRLEAVELGGNDRAFISGKLVTVGDKLFVSDVAEIYECEVVGIEENTVIVRCGKVQVTLKLAHTVEVNPVRKPKLNVLSNGANL